MYKSLLWMGLAFQVLGVLSQPDALFNIFKALYFESGLQFEYDFQVGSPNLNGKTQIWVEGNINLESSKRTNPENYITESSINATTGNIILEQRTRNTLKLSGCELNTVVTESYNGSWYLSVGGVTLTHCDSVVEVTARGDFPTAPDVTADVLEVFSAGLDDLAHKHLTFHYDSYIDSYPINPIKENAMQALFGLAMHANGRVQF